MPTDTGLEEIALENLQASKTRLRGDANVVLVPIEADDELPTRDELVEASDSAVCQYISANCGRIPDAEETVRLTVATLIARGWLKVRE